jgi:DNA-binding MarR family transcriptional regulator
VQENPPLRLVSASPPSPSDFPTEPIGPDDRSELAATEERVTIELGGSEVAALKKILGVLESAEARKLAEEEAAREAAAAIFGLSKARAKIFPPSMFGAPAWEMMLALYVSHELPTAADLARWTDTALSTAMRWIAYLEAHKLVLRETRDDDRRAQSIRLSDDARGKMAALFAEFATYCP